jgi:hypothetical protein
MRSVRDTFLHFLADNLPGVTVRYVRKDPNDPSADNLAVNALNVQFLNVELGHIDTHQTVLDLIYDTDEAALEAMQSAWEILKAGAYTPLLDYTVPSSPVAVGKLVFWDRNKVQFRKLYDDNHCRYSCTLPLRVGDN